jgi:hypothetical protein
MRAILFNTSTLSSGELGVSAAHNLLSDISLVGIRGNVQTAECVPQSRKLSELVVFFSRQLNRGELSKLRN